MVHAGAQRTRGRVEVLHLLWLMARVAQVLRQLDRVPERASRMAAHEIGHQVLPEAQPPVHGVIPLNKGLVDLAPGLAHAVQHALADVLGRDLELPADVMAAQLGQKRVALVRHHVVKADARADKDLFDAGERPEPGQQRQQLAVAHAQPLAGRWIEALTVFARALPKLPVAGGHAEVGRGAADVVNVALEVGKRSQQPRFPHERFLAARGDDPALMKGQGAEAARAEAAAHGAEGEADLP